MPKEGYKTITLKEDVYDSLYDEYLERKEVMKLNGIFSFSDYVEHKSRISKPTTVDDLKELLCIQIHSQFTLNDLLLGVDRETCQKNHFTQQQHMFEFLKKFRNE